MDTTQNQEKKPYRGLLEILEQKVGLIEKQLKLRRQETKLRNNLFGILGLRIFLTADQIRAAFQKAGLENRLGQGNQFPNEVKTFMDIAYIKPVMYNGEQRYQVGLGSWRLEPLSDPRKYSKAI